MGMFEFMKNKGAQLFGIQTEAQANEEKSLKISNFIENLGLKVQNFQPTIENDQATLKGQVETSEIREKVILAVGNVEGISKVHDNMLVSTPAPQAQFYTVQSGDSLSKISKDFYGDPMKYNSIFEANKPMLAHPDKIYPGQTLRIPTMEV